MQRFRNSRIHSFIGVVLIYVVAGCTTIKTYTDSTLDAAIDDLRSGDRISVYTVQGAIYEIEVAEVSTDAILAMDRAIDKQDIVKIAKRKYSAGKTTAAVVGGTLVTFLAAVGAFILWDINTPDD